LAGLNVKELKLAAAIAARGPAARPFVASFVVARKHRSHGRKRAIDPNITKL
jgi:hypothetical protein